ncbi:MAG: acyloxyacyl hydrolase [Sphingorhabdus sp.]
MKRALLILASWVTLFNASFAHADELWLGVTDHGVNTPFTLETGENGADIQGGWRGKRIDGLSFIGSPSPYILASASTDGETSFAAIGISWKIGSKVYIRPGIGLAIHDGPIPRGRPGEQRTDLGSRILFEPEIALGVQINESLSAEASWVHISNAGILSRQNPGLDVIGARLVLRLK